MYKHIIEGKKAVFFDLDGTIIDSAEYWQRAFNNIARVHKIPVINSYVIHHGMSLGKALNISIARADKKPEKPVEQLAEMVNDEYLKIFEKEPLVAKDGFWELIYELKELRKLPIALVSNSVRKVITKVLNLVDIDENIFDLIIAGDEVVKRKPHPEIYLTAARKLGVKPQEVLVFEDSISGLEAATGAQMDVIVIWSGVVNAAEYEKTTKILLPDFTSLPGNLDQTFQEYLNDKITNNKA